MSAELRNGNKKFDPQNITCHNKMIANSIKYFLLKGSFNCPILNLLSIYLEQPLLMIQNSSKRLAKIKKKFKKYDPSDYYFLISSLERDNDKENYPSNQFYTNKTSLKNSRQINSRQINNSRQIKNPLMISSLDNFKRSLSNKIEFLQPCKIKMKNISNVPFFQNVKFLKNSRISQRNQEELENKFSLSTNKYKNTELKQKVRNKQFNESSKNPHKSSKFVQNISETLQQKLEAYTQYVSELFQEITSKHQLSNLFSRKKLLLETLSKQLLRQAKKYSDGCNGKFLNKSIEVSHFSSFPSKPVSRQLEKSINLIDKSQSNDYKKIIDELSHQNSKLTQLISQHQRKNIKMFIRINQNQSKQIQKCKKYLSTLYDKYKILEKFIIKENEKYSKALAEKKCLQKKIEQLQNTNVSIKSELQKIKSMFEQIQNQTLSKISFDNDQYYHNIFNFQINKNLSIDQKEKEQPIKSNQFSKIDKSFMTKRDKAQSCLSNHLNIGIKTKDQQMMSCSTITKVKNIKKKKQKIGLGVNLKDQFDNFNEEQGICSLKKQIKTLKQRFYEEAAQRLVLQKQLTALQNLLKKKTQKSQKMEAIIGQQLEQIEKIMKINAKLSSNLEQAQQKKTENKKSNNKFNSNQLLSKLSEIQSQKNTLLSENSKSNREVKMFDQYRIIALQANALENILNFS